MRARPACAPASRAKRSAQQQQWRGKLRAWRTVRARPSAHAARSASASAHAASRRSHGVYFSPNMRIDSMPLLPYAEARAHATRTATKAARLCHHVIRARATPRVEERVPFLSPDLRAASVDAFSRAVNVEAQSDAPAPTTAMPPVCLPPAPCSFLLNAAPRPRRRVHAAVI